MADTREKLIDIITYYADFLDWERVDGIADTIMENCFATDNNVGGNWISVEDRLPEENARVWVFCGGNTEVMIYRRDANGDCRFYWEDELGLLSAWYKPKATHWMPLPEPPGADMRGDA